MKGENFIGAYEAPKVEIVEVEVEKGYATTDSRRRSGAEDGEWC